IEAAAIIGNKVFIERGMADVVAYMDYFGTNYPSHFNEACEKYKYNYVFLLPPWKEIYLTDNERFESFDQALAIHEHLKKSYLSFGYSLIEVLKDSVEARSKFILNNL